MKDAGFNCVPTPDTQILQLSTLCEMTRTNFEITSYFGMITSYFGKSTSVPRTLWLYNNITCAVELEN